MYAWIGKKSVISHSSSPLFLSLFFILPDLYFFGINLQNWAVARVFSVVLLARPQTVNNILTPSLRIHREKF